MYIHVHVKAQVHSNIKIVHMYVTMNLCNFPTGCPTIRNFSLKFLRRFLFISQRKTPKSHNFLLLWIFSEYLL